MVHLQRLGVIAFERILVSGFVGDIRPFQRRQGSEGFRVWKERRRRDVVVVFHA